MHDIVKKMPLKPVPTKYLLDFKSCLEMKFTTVVITRKNWELESLSDFKSGKKNKRGEGVISHTNCKFMAKTCGS